MCEKLRAVIVWINKLYRIVQGAYFYINPSGHGRQMVISLMVSVFTYIRPPSESAH